jgi:cytochrome c oxidase cbb3-type subunit 3
MVSVFLFVFLFLLIAIEITVNAVDTITYSLLSDEQKAKVDALRTLALRKVNGIKIF